MICANCGTSEGPFITVSLVLGSNKSPVQFKVCGLRGKALTKDAINAKVADCNKRRAKAEEARSR